MGQSRGKQLFDDRYGMPPPHSRIVDARPVPTTTAQTRKAFFRCNGTIAPTIPLSILQLCEIFSQPRYYCHHHGDETVTPSH